MEENLIKKVMPHNAEAETSVIGSMFLNTDAISVALETLNKDDFYERRLGIFFETIVEMYNAGIEIDPITVSDKIKTKDISEEYADIAYITKLAASVPTAANIKYYADIVREKSLLRQFIKLSEQFSGDCYQDKEEMSALFAEAESKFFKLFQSSTKMNDLTSISQVVLQSIENISKASKNSGAVTGIATGFIDLDYMTAGMQPSDLVLVAARPSMGKTAFVLNLAEYIALHENKTTAIFSLEMSKTQLVNRILSMRSRVDAQHIRTGRLDDTEWKDLMMAAKEVGNSKLIIDDTPGISVEELRSKCRKLKLENDLKIVIIDYIQLMTSGKKTDSRQQEVSDISRNLKAIAREIDCPVIALSQLSREVEKRPDKRPMLSDLRESGAIEQDADVVMFIYRDEYYNKDTEHPGEAEIIIGKQRNGPTGTVSLKWLGEYTKFANLKRD